MLQQLRCKESKKRSRMCGVCFKFTSLGPGPTKWAAAVLGAAPLLLPRTRRGPDVGGCKSGKRDRFVPDRSRARLSARQSVQCVPVMARSLGHLRAEGTQQERSRTRIVLALQVCTTAAHRDVDAAPMERWSDRGLQVTNLKATGAQLSSAQTNTGHDKPHTIILAPPCMHQTCCMHLQLGARRLSVETV